MRGDVEDRAADLPERRSLGNVSGEKRSRGRRRLRTVTPPVTSAGNAKFPPTATKEPASGERLSRYRGRVFDFNSWSNFEKPPERETELAALVPH